MDAILADHGVELQWKQRNEDGTFTDAKARVITQDTLGDFAILEPGYVETDYKQVFCTADLKKRDRLVIDGEDWEVQSRRKYEAPSIGQAHTEAIIRKVLT